MDAAELPNWIAPDHCSSDRSLKLKNETMRLHKQKRSPSIHLLPFILVLVIGALAFGGYKFLSHFEGEAPVVEAAIGAAWNPTREFTIHVTDRKSGIRRVQIVLKQQGRDAQLFDQLFEKNIPHRLDLPFKVDLRRHRISEGPATLCITARDMSWRGWFHGNKTELRFDTVIDTRAPRLTVLTRFHNISQGGAGLVIYQLSKPCPKHGVQVGEHFFHGTEGLFKNPLIMAAMIALDYKAGTGTEMVVTATDEAGNTARSSFPYHILRKAFRRETIPITDAFLKQKMPEFRIDPASGESDMSLIDKFIFINQQQRETDTQRLSSLVQHQSQAMLWDAKAFLRLPNAAPKAGFGDHRIYLYNGRVIDEQDHMGVDLASLRQSPVPAANTGVVVETGPFGIYGNTVMIDHGMGLFFLLCASFDDCGSEGTESEQGRPDRNDRGNRNGCRGSSSFCHDGGRCLCQPDGMVG